MHGTYGGRPRQVTPEEWNERYPICTRVEVTTYGSGGVTGRTLTKTVGLATKWQSWAFVSVEGFEHPQPAISLRVIE